MEDSASKSKQLPYDLPVPPLDVYTRELRARIQIFSYLSVFIVAYSQ